MCNKIRIILVFLFLSVLVLFLQGCVMGLIEDGVEDGIDVGIDGAEAAAIGAVTGL